MLKPILFALLSIGIVALSRASLRVPRSHGFYRFFAGEFLLALILLNSDYWFRDPFSLQQVISWLLLIFSTVLAIHGAYLLRRIGKPDARRDDVPLIGIEKTTTLVTAGAYHYIRHPLYSSLLMLGWGVFLKDPAWLGGCLALAMTFCLILTARVEEAENKRFFGTTYQEYVKRTRMFIPFIY